MSQDDPGPDELDAPVGDDLVRELYEHVQKLESRVTDLEESKEHLEEENADLREDNETLKRKVTTLEEENAALREQTDTLEEEVEDLTSTVNTLNSRADALYEEIDQAQKDITDQSFHAEERLSDIIKRVAGIENELGLEEWETTNQLGPNACALERFSAMPEEKREDELKTPVMRATLVWENFDDWSSPTHKGRVIRSGELRKLLKAATGKKLAWTQVYRVMEEFEDNTTAQYKYLGQDGEDEAFGKALIRLRDPSDHSEGAASSSNGGGSPGSGSAVSW